MFQGHIDLDAAMPVEASAVPDVLFERGLYWASGRSGVVNLVAAHKWFNLAALKGRADAIRLRREVAELMSEVEIAMAQPGPGWRRSRASGGTPPRSLAALAGASSVDRRSFRSCTEEQIYARVTLIHHCCRTGEHALRKSEAADGSVTRAICG